jgi:Spy/CpxP family protein refolding chaperone
MKKIVMTMVALLTMTAAVAQNSDNNNGRQRREFKKPTPEEMTNRMADQLKLDDKQKSKVLDLNKEYEGVLGGPGMGRGFGRGMRGQRPDAQSGATEQNGQQRPQMPQLTEEQRAQMKQMMEKRQEYDKKLKDILTDDQYKTYQQQRRGGRGGFGGRGQRGQRPAVN